MARIREEANPADLLKYEYIEQTFAPETEDLKKIRDYSINSGKAPMQMSPVEAKILQCLVKWSGAKRVLEVGLLHGYTCLWMAKALPEGGVIYSLEASRENFDAAKEMLSTTEEYSKIKLIQGDAKETLKTLESEEPFDLVFIDANKGAYLDYALWAEKHLKPGGFIVGDNTFLFGGVYAKDLAEKWGEKQIQVMKDFNSLLANPKKYHGCMIPTVEGLTIAQKI